jgi:hypothetical protein
MTTTVIASTPIVTEGSGSILKNGEMRSGKTIAAPLRPGNA